MNTMNLEIAGKETSVVLFDSMWEYIDHYGATVEEYELTPHENEGKCIIGAFKPVDDVFFHVAAWESAEVDGALYQHVNWGEEEYAMIPEGDIEVEFWTLYYWREKIGGYVSGGEIFRTEEQAVAAMEREVA